MAEDDPVFLSAVMEGAAEKGDSLIARVASHFFADEFQSAMERFINENAGAFRNVTEEQLAGDGEHQLEHWSIYQEFLKTFEAKMETYVTLEGSTVPELYRVVRAEHDKAKDEWGEAAVFTNLLLSACEYPSFLQLMKAEAEDAREEAKEAEDSDGKVEDSESKMG